MFSFAFYVFQSPNMSKIIQFSQCIYVWLVSNDTSQIPVNCHNPNDNTVQHNLNTVVRLDTKMTVHFPPPTQPHKLKISLHEPQINTHWPQLNIMWPVTTSRATTTTFTTQNRQQQQKQKQQQKKKKKKEQE